MQRRQRTWCSITAACCLTLAACGDDSASVHVASSGPTLCDAYCGFMAINCTRGHLQYYNNASCLSTCATFPINADPNVSTGDTLQCRMLYASTADAPEREQAFCDNAGPTGGSDCQP